jgi:uncharacterized protein (DUF433 family)
MSNSTVSNSRAISWPFLERDSQGRVKISGTRLRLSMLIEARQAHGWSPEEIHFQYPVLSLAQVYSALSYYYAHPEEIEQEIVHEHQEIEKMKQELKATGAFQRGEELKAKLLARANQG